MQISIKETGLFGHIDVTLNPGEPFVSEAGALFKMSGNTRLDTSTRQRKRGGGILAAAKRVLASTSFFLTEYGSKDGNTVTFSLAPLMPGDCAQIDLDGSCRWYCTGGSWLGCGGGVAIDTEFAGFKKGLVGGEGMFYVICSGVGPALVSAFGKIHKIEVDGEYNVDSGHVVAYQDSLKVDVGVATGAGFGGFVSSSLVGEGFVMKFQGRGTVYTQSHSPGRLGSTVGPKLPERN